MIRPTDLLFLTLAVVCLSLCDAKAGSLYATVTSGSSIVSDSLVRIDPTTGAATTIGLTGFNDIQGLAYDSSAGVIYGYAGSTTQLISLNPLTGQGTAVTSPGTFTTSGLTGSGASVVGLAYSPARDDILAITNSFSDLRILSVDPVTGDESIVTSVSGLTSSGQQSVALNPENEILYTVSTFLSTDELISIDTGTANATLIGPTGIDSVLGLTWSSDNLIYGVDFTTNSLFSIDATTGASTAIGPLGTNVAFSLVYVPVPEPGSCLLLSAFISVVVIRRRRAACPVRAYWAQQAARQ